MFEQDVPLKIQKDEKIACFPTISVDLHLLTFACVFGSDSDGIFHIFRCVDDVL